MNIPKDLKYTKEHEWIKVDCGKAIVGITDYAQKELGDIVFADLATEGTTLTKEGTFGVIESLKTVSELYSPVSGALFEVNKTLDDTPELANSSPYENGWMISIDMSDESELDQLLSSEEYESYLKSL